ncbi:S-adenosyl-L-methionine-dependent methyltransferase [Gymnopus androsaceus JB14]|uniref:rRNA adenine N(6)-methyltransferase n=1 Tax=Gymnopus androsaceus JB14 TaxID=1447944 RepID=A0A6A4HU76_9AGAR|nr:S-adenosyl-L-methionine-dependent methyltransferase [Gymnopus androsaceus JB14]
MPKATSDRFSRLHKDSQSESSSARNPIFNTERFGQHILKNPQVAQTIVEKANIKPTDIVLEVGPGTGNLTVLILEQAKQVTAVEMDPRMAAELTKRVQGKPSQKKLSLIIGDFVKADLPYFDVCISNTPYQISSPLIFHLLSHRPLPRICILMFQREFALRLGREAEYRIMVSSIRQCATIRKGGLCDACGEFSGESGPRDPPPPVRFEEFDGLGRIVFSRRNKTVHGNFMAKGVVEMLERNWRTWCSETNQIIEDDVNMKAKVEKILDDTGNSENRAAKMDVDDLLKLLSAFHDAGIHFA